jgi:hypothetical protein
MGIDQLPGVSNYLIGNDSSKWLTNVANYSEVHYQGLYPGVDAIFNGYQGSLNYDFVVAPKADPGVISLNFNGAQPKVNSDGSLTITENGVTLTQSAPLIYQDSPTGRQAVSGQYVIHTDGTVGFSVGSYDNTRPLVIDPALLFSTFLGGDGEDAGQAIAVDPANNAYVTGSSASTNFPTTAGAFQSINVGGDDVVVSKLTPDGTALVYSTYVGGGLADHGMGIAVDDLGNAYVTGDTASTDFPTTTGAFQRTNNGGTDAFVFKLNPTGTALVYSTFMGGTKDDHGTAIALNSAGEAFITGDTTSTNFPTAGGFQAANDGGADAFVGELSADGTKQVYSSFLGGKNDDFGTGIAINSAGQVYVTGFTVSSDFPTTAGAYQRSSPGGLNAFVTEVSAGGSATIFSTYLGGTQDDRGRAIALDTNGDVFVTGDTNSVNFPTTTGAVQASGGGLDAFVTKLAPNGASLVYSTYFGGSGNDIGRGLAVDGNGFAYITGSTTSANLITVNPVESTLHSGQNAFVAVLNGSGGGPLFSTYLGGSGNDQGNGVALDSGGNLFVVGTTASLDFPVTPGALQVAEGGGSDFFVSKFLAAAINGTGNGSQTFLADVFEPNDTSDTATNFGVLGPGGTIMLNNLTIANHPDGLPDYDWFRVTLGGSGTFIANMIVTAGGPLEAHLWMLDSSGFIDEMSMGTGGSVTLPGIFAPGTVVFVEVKGVPTGPSTFTQGAYNLTMQLQ